MDCYGLVGMASRSQLKDGITDLLGWENLNKGIEVHTENGELVIDLHIIVGYGTKISEGTQCTIQSKVHPEPVGGLDGEQSERLCSGRTLGESGLRGIGFDTED